jgi:hypothetical protein
MEYEKANPKRLAFFKHTLQTSDHVGFLLSPGIAVQRDDVSENPNRGDCK